MTLSQRARRPRRRPSPATSSPSSTRRCTGRSPAWSPGCRCSRWARGVAGVGRPAAPRRPASSSRSSTCSPGSASPSASTACFTHRSFKARPGGARAARDPRLGGDRGAGHLVGRRPPQAPRVLRPAGRPAQPARRPRRRSGAARCAACCTRTSAGCSATTSAAARRATRPTCSPTPSIRFVDRTFVVWALARPRARRSRSAWRIGGIARGRPDRAAVGRRACACSSCTT